VWSLTHQIGLKARVKNFNPRLLRAYFAANWIVQKKSVEGLRRILRHKSLAITHAYVQRLVFFEDVQAEFNELQNGPIQDRVKGELGEFYKQWCSTCLSEAICKIIDQMCASLGATGCKFHMPVKKLTV